MLKKIIVALSSNLPSQSNILLVFWVVQSLQQISTVAPLYKSSEVYKNRHRTYIKSLRSRVLFEQVELLISIKVNVSVPSMVT